MLVSVVVPDLNSPTVDQTLDSLRRQTWSGGDSEILVVGLDEPGLVQEDSAVRFIGTGGPVPPGSARNRGVEAAQGRYILFIDADCLAEPDWMERLMGRLQCGIPVVSGAVTFAEDNYWTLTDNISMFHEFLPGRRAGPRPYLPSTNLGVEREVFVAAGGFDESLPRGEDIDLTIRLRKMGHQLHFEPEAVVHHAPGRASFEQVWEHWWASGYNMVRVRLRHAEEFGTPALLRSSTALITLSPLIALAASTRIFWRDRSLWRYLHLLPAIYLTKVAWCLGAAQRLNRRGNLS